MTLASSSHQLEAIETAARTFAGVLLRPGNGAYEDARKVHNGLIDRRPALIAHCVGTADVADAVKLARDLNLEITVRGGGHNVGGRAVAEGGLMIDLSWMRGVQVDAAKKVALAQGGATWKDFNRETQLHGLATTGGVVSTTGVGGLTLGGGLGWLMPKYGMALDNLLSAQVVDADGTVMRASATENADLFWALRGGGGNFGVVTSFEFQLHRVGPMVTGGLAAHPFDRARDVLRFYRDQTASLPDEMMAFCGLVHAPDGSGAKLAALVVCHCGELTEAARAVAPFKSFGPPVMDAIGPIPYTAINAMLDAGFPRGALNYWKSNFLSTLSDEAIDTLVACFARCPTPMGSLLLEHFHGAPCRVKPDATAFAQRSESYNLAILGQWANPKDTAASSAWVKETHAAMKPFAASRRYLNYMGDDESGDVLGEVFGANLPRLYQLKAKYDPGNVFHHNLNIAPAA